MKNVIFSNEKMPLIRYELEEMERTRFKPPASLNSEFASLDSTAKRARKHCSWNVEHEMPYFHPGRVLVSHEVMSRIGRREVLFHLNCLVRGGGGDGAYAGEYIQACFYGGHRMRSYNPFTESIALCLTINAARTCTVIRFNYETLHYRRRMADSSFRGSHPPQTVPKERFMPVRQTTFLKDESSGQSDDLVSSIAASSLAFRKQPDSDPNEALSDMLEDFMFWCYRHQIDFDAALGAARDRYLAGDFF